MPRARTGRDPRRRASGVLLALSLLIALAGSGIAMVRSVDLAGAAEPAEPLPRPIAPGGAIRGAEPDRGSRHQRPPRILSHRLLQESYRPYGYVAHALGSVRGHRYTNSREAFEESYAKGFRLFEIDLIALRDGGVLAAHDGMEASYGLDRPFTSLRRPRARRLFYRGTPDRPLRLRHHALTGKGIVSLMRTHEDAYLITDTKGGTSPGPHVRILRELVRIAPKSVLRRIIPHVESQAHLDAFMKVYPFRNYMLALYRGQRMGRLDDEEVVDFVRRNHRITGVMMWAWKRNPALSLEENAKQHRRFRAGFVRQLQDLGAAVYVHSIDSPRWMGRFRDRDVGVYSNSWYPA